MACIDFILRVVWTSYLTRCWCKSLNMMFIQLAKWNRYTLFFITYYCVFKTNTKHSFILCKMWLSFNRKQNTHKHDTLTGRLFCSYESDLDSMTLVYECDLDILKLYQYPHTKNELSRSRHSTALQTDTQTDVTKNITTLHSQMRACVCTECTVFV